MMLRVTPHSFLLDYIQLAILTFACMLILPQVQQTGLLVVLNSPRTRSMEFFTQ